MSPTDGAPDREAERRVRDWLSQEYPQERPPAGSLERLLQRVDAELGKPQPPGLHRLQRWEFRYAAHTRRVVVIAGVGALAAALLLVLRFSSQSRPSAGPPTLAVSTQPYRGEPLPPESTGTRRRATLSPSEAVPEPATLPARTAPGANQLKEPKAPGTPPSPARAATLAPVLPGDTLWMWFRSALGDSATRGLRDLVQAARASNLPVRPLLERARAGVAVGASGSSVVAVDSALALRLAQARAALAPGSSEAEITAGAEALAIGVTPAMLTSVRRHRAAGHGTVAILVLAGWTQDGVPHDSATRALERLARAGVPDTSLLAIRDGVSRAVAEGTLAVQALQQFVQGTLGGSNQAPAAGTPPIPRVKDPDIPFQP